jgi:hypothetical protein
MKRYTVASALTVLTVLLLANVAWAQGATNFAMVGITRGQTLQLNLVAWPPDPAYPPAPICMAELRFQDSSGKPLGTTKTVTLTTGQSASLTLNGDSFVKPRERVEVLPIVTTEGTYPPVPCFASVEVIDHVLAITTVGVPGAVTYPPAPIFGMLGVTSFQTVRLNVVAFPPAPIYPPDPCIAQLSFADKDGNPVGQTKDVNLSPGDAAFLDLPGSILFPPQPFFDGFGQHVEVHPIVTLAVGAPTNCLASVEVYYNFNKQTTVYWPPVPVAPATTTSENMTPLFPHVGWLRRNELVGRYA